MNVGKFPFYFQSSFPVSFLKIDFVARETCGLLCFFLSSSKTRLACQSVHMHTCTNTVKWNDVGKSRKNFQTRRRREIQRSVRSEVANDEGPVFVSENFMGMHIHSNALFVVQFVAATS